MGRIGVAVIALVGVLSSSAPASALAITGNFLSSTTGPDDQPALGGGNIQQIFGAAASYWEAILFDPISVVVDYGWFDEPPGSTLLAFSFGDARTGFLNVVNRQDWFLDPSPLVPNEYTTPEFVVTNYGGFLVNSGVGFSGGTGAAAGYDLLTVLIHELGHVLGNRPETALDYADGHVDITSPRPLAGLALPVIGGCCHLTDGDGIPGFNPSLFPFTNLGERRLISDADLLFVAQGGLWDQVDESRFESASVPEPGSLTLLGLGLCVAEWSRRRRRTGPWSRDQGCRSRGVVGLGLDCTNA